MSSAFKSGKQYFYVSNIRTRVLLEAAIEVASEICATEQHREFITRLEHWLNQEYWPGADVGLELRFPTAEEQKFWAQVFQNLAWLVFKRKWGNQENETWQVDFISECEIISYMATSLVWKVERGWYPVNGDIDGMRPDPMRIQR